MEQSNALTYQEQNVVQIKDKNEVYTFVCTIGAGTYGTVAKVKKEGKSGQYYAVKTVEKSGDLTDEEYLAFRETSNIKNVVKAISLIKTENHNHIVMELMEGGDLFNYLSLHGPMSRFRAISLFKKLVITVGELLNIGLYPGDLKTENLYYSREKKALIILDLGGMKHMKTENGSKKQVATTSFSPPEFHLEKSEDKKEEHNYGELHLSWTLGLILWEMVTGERKPIDNLKDIIYFELQIPNEIIWLNNSETYYLIKNLLEVNPAKRLTFGSLHKLFL